MTRKRGGRRVDGWTGVKTRSLGRPRDNDDSQGTKTVRERDLRGTGDNLRGGRKGRVGAGSGRGKRTVDPWEVPKYYEVHRHAAESLVSHTDGPGPTGVRRVRGSRPDRTPPDRWGVPDRSARDLLIPPCPRPPPGRRYSSVTTRDPVERDLKTLVSRRPEPMTPLASEHTREQ